MSVKYSIVILKIILMFDYLLELFNRKSGRK